MTNTPYYGLSLRKREPSPARYLPEQLSERFSGMKATAERQLEEPYRGIGLGGDIARDVFALAPTGVTTRPILDAALAFLATLSDGQRAAVAFPVDSDAWRRWYNIHPFIMRHGLMLEDLTPSQREAALGLLAATLSARGFQASRDIMHLNETIGELTGSWTEYGEWVYWISVFGTPSADQPWGWQLDGHHLIVNAFVLGDQLVMTPTFMGSEPTTAEDGKYAGTTVCQEEQAAGLDLVNSLTPDQRRIAVIQESILTQDLPPGRLSQDNLMLAGAFHDNETIPNEGINMADLSAGQRDLALRLIESYIGHMRPGHAAVRMEEVRRHLDSTYFCWMGGTKSDSVFYYRLQSPVVLIEFDHQRGIAFANDEPSPNHIHTIVRTPNGNDYGRDLLRRHYEQHHAVSGMAQKTE